jgi:hypothetical protein
MPLSISLSLSLSVRHIWIISTIDHSEEFRIVFCSCTISNLCYTHSTQASAAFTNFRHVGELTIFNTGICTKSLKVFGRSLSSSEAPNLVQDSRPGNRGVCPERYTQ